MKHGEMVAVFEKEFAQYAKANFAIAAGNGTVTLQAALMALGVKAGTRVAVPPLTMSATTIAVLNVGGLPVFTDIDPETWLMDSTSELTALPVALYGLIDTSWDGPRAIMDAAQTLAPLQYPMLQSYSFQASKILALGEGGMLVTNEEGLAVKAREYLSLGYRMGATQPRIDSAQLKSPTFNRHHSYPSLNGRMNDLTAKEGLKQLAKADDLLANRRKCAAMYQQAIDGCRWLDPQHVPQGWTHDYWAFVVALRPEHYPPQARGYPGFYAATFEHIADTIQKHGGERPYGAWKLTYQEPAFRHLASPVSTHVAFTSLITGKVSGLCPNAESLQPRLLQMATNNIDSAERNANALHAAIRELS
jgi:perosamine synthetase